MAFALSVCEGRGLAAGSQIWLPPRRTEKVFVPSLVAAGDMSGLLGATAFQTSRLCWTAWVSREGGQVYTSS